MQMSLIRDYALGKGIGGHHRGHRGRSDEWLTPPPILRALGPFDLDPCSPIDRPWDTAAKHYTIADDGLAQCWHGRVWMNPPYGPALGRWLARLAEHGNGIALVFARTETDAFHKYGWLRADAMLFLWGRLNFYDVTGKRADKNAGGPSVLIAYGAANAATIQHCRIPGAFVRLTGVTS
jgi:hypothetical protein